MLDFLKEEANKTYTENGALTYATTYSACLDLFAAIGALRQAEEADIIKRFSLAYAENPDLAMKIIFFARDIRGGLGERRVFRIILRYLAGWEQDSVVKNIEYIPEYGRFDDLIVLMNTSCHNASIQYIAKQLKKDNLALERGEDNISLLAKWLPSVNASNSETRKNAKQIAKALKMQQKDYRKTLTKLRAKIDLLENYLREKNYTFDYEKQPSKAMFKYRKAFFRNDEIRYRKFLDAVNEGKAKLHTSTLYPYEIIEPLLKQKISAEERKVADTTWNSLPNYTTNENAIVVIDGSGSMYWNVQPSPAAIALSLGIYFAERNKGAFYNHFITFSEHPRLVEIKGKDIAEKVNYCASYNEVANTNLKAVFELILNTAMKNHLPQEQLPDTIYIISDMEFDSCTRDSSKTNFQHAQDIFRKNEYNLPKVVFWNVASRNIQQPVKQNQQGVTLVSGCSPRLFDMVMCERLSPYEYMMQICNAERYAKILS